MPIVVVTFLVIVNVTPDRQAMHLFYMMGLQYEYKVEKVMVVTVSPKCTPVHMVKASACTHGPFQCFSLATFLDTFYNSTWKNINKYTFTGLYLLPLIY